MRNIFLLVKNYFNTFIGSFAKSKKVGKYFLALILILATSLLMVAFFTYNSYVITSEFINLSENFEYANFAMFYNCSTLAMMAVLMIVMRAAVPAQVTDADLLLGLPLKKHQIIIAKSLTAYFLDFIVLFVFLFPSYIVFVALVKGASSSIIFRSLLVLLILPLLTNALSTIIGTFINIFAKKMRFVSIIQTVLMFALIAVFLVFNYYINNILVQNSDLNLDSAVNKIFIIKFLYQYILNNQSLYFIIILGFTLIVYGIALYLKIKTFGQKNINYQNKRTNLQYEESSPFTVLLKKESNRFFNLPVYIMNAGFGIILSIGISFYLLYMGRGVIDTLVVNILKTSLDNSPYIVIFLACALLSTVCTTYCSISLEGKTFWILRANPIQEMTVFKAKIAFNVILAGFGIIITGIILSLLFGFQYLAFLIIIPFLSSLFIAQLGLLINLIYPRLEWESEMVPIKQSISVLLVMGIGFLLPILCLVIFMLLSPLLEPLLVMILVIIVLIILNIIIYSLLKTKGIKLFRELS